MPRLKESEGVWLYKNANEWTKLPEKASINLENTRRYQGEHFVDTTVYRDFPPLFELSPNSPEFRQVLVNFREGTISLAEKNQTTQKRNADGETKENDELTSLQVKRYEKFNVQKERVKIDRERGVEILPRFYHPFLLGEYGIGDAPKTVLERQITDLSAQIREKPNWEAKFRDPDILEKWRKESQSHVTDEVFKYVIDELAYYQSLQNGSIKPSTVDGVWQADDHVPESLRAALLREVAKLENVPDKEKDWHPGSNGQVLNLVHPSLYCFIAGVTRQTTTPAHPPFAHIGSGKVLTTDLTEEILDCITLTSAPEGGKFLQDFDECPTVEKSMDAYEISTSSKTYQWLPTEFGISKEGKAEVLSYINNLDPRKNVPLYKVLTKILETFIPLWDRVLTDLANPRPPRYAPDPYRWYKHEEQREDEDDDAFSQRLENRPVELPPLPPFVTPSPPTRTISLLGRQIQVIVKLANIILTPEKPEYKGGVWHVEGMNNEHIVASGIYYYDSENITESRLKFRVAIEEPNYEQYDRKGVYEVYGLSDSDPLNQPLGSVITKSGRSIAFPNLFQHYVNSFALQDSTKPGHRKILVFFLVDPALRILSTLHVPPQQPQWLCDTLAKFRPFSTLPPHILRQIVDYVTPLSQASAERHREELMKERKFFQKMNAEDLFERPFSLCEH